MQSWFAVARTFVLTIAIAVVASPVPTRAADRPCQGDVQKFCAGVQPGAGRIATCLKEHQAELSDLCKAHIHGMKTKAREHFKACADDVDKFCKDTQPGGGRIAKCLVDHESNLSAACKAEIAKRRHGRRSEPTNAAPTPTK